MESKLLKDEEFLTKVHESANEFIDKIEDFSERQRFRKISAFKENNDIFYILRWFRNK